MSLYLCVDCGGSKTLAVVANSDGEIVGRALGGPSNFSYMSVADFQVAIRTAVSGLLPDKPGALAAAWFGISGVDSPAAARNAASAITPLLPLLPPDALTVANDTHLLAAPLRLHPDINQAITAIAGTGSCVVSFTQDANGALVELARTGGWGWILGDEGGGFHVGRETIRLMMDDLARASLGMPVPASKLKDEVLARFGIEGQANAAEILTVVHVPEPHPHEHDKADVPPHRLVAREKRLSQLCPLVFDAAFKEGDAFALRVLRNCAGELADQIAMLCVTPGGETKPRGVRADEAILCFGGSLVGVEAYRNIVLDELKKRHCVFRYVDFVDDAAAVGASSLAKLTRP